MIEAYERASTSLGLRPLVRVPGTRRRAWSAGSTACPWVSAFFAESMFHRARDASKCALAALVWQLEAWGFTVFDCQLPTAHLRSLGASECPRTNFRRRLTRALQKETRRGAWRLEPDLLSARLDRERAQLTRRV